MPTLIGPRPCLWHVPDKNNRCKKCWQFLHFHDDFLFWPKVRRALRVYFWRTNNLIWKLKDLKWQMDNYNVGR